MRSLRISCLSLALAFAGAAAAQTRDPGVDVGVTFNAARSLSAATGLNFWMEGGSAEFGVDAWKGFGFAANITGTHGSSIGTSGIPLSLITAVGGPRFRFHPAHRVSLYAEFLAGRANGFDSLFPMPGGAQSAASSLALQAGGGLDLMLNHRFGVRAIQASWLRTQLPNATDNIQNTLELGAGVVFHFGR